MTKVLQIRRGTTAQNDAFTGLVGEITVDTEQHTMRVHDGSTLGGFTLARVDQMPSFDIDSVPDAWWENKIPQFCPAPFTVLTGTAQCEDACYIEYLFNTNSAPKFINVSLVANSNDAGYATGDEVFAFGNGDMPALRPNYFIDLDGLHIRLMTAQQAFWVAHHDTGVKTAINNSDWDVKFVVYC